MFSEIVYPPFARCHSVVGLRFMVSDCLSGPADSPKIDAMRRDQDSLDGGYTAKTQARKLLDAFGLGVI